MKKFSIAVHGGAGNILSEKMTPELEQQYHAALREALQLANDCLANGGQAYEAVEIAVVSLEDSELFNAGKGSVFAHNGRHILEASIMEGKDLNAGSVAGLQHVRNPVRLASKVMMNSSHVMLIGAGAEGFARENNVELVENDWFSTDFRKMQLERIRETPDIDLDHLGLAGEKKFGTVGAVAMDQHGNLAAATSTGGVTNKRWGRVGDSPLIGCGTYAENGYAAVSTTGYGEVFIRKAVAHDVIARMKYGGQSLAEVIQALVHEDLPTAGGDGGLIAIDHEGNIQYAFNTKGMYRGHMANGEVHTAIFAE